jgi:hypothetical protein
MPRLHTHTQDGRKQDAVDLFTGGSAPPPATNASRVGTVCPHTAQSNTILLPDLKKLGQLGLRRVYLPRLP